MTDRIVRAAAGYSDRPGYVVDVMVEATTGHHGPGTSATVLLAVDDYEGMAYLTDDQALAVADHLRAQVWDGRGPRPDDLALVLERLGIETHTDQLAHAYDTDPLVHALVSVLRDTLVALFQAQPTDRAEEERRDALARQVAAAHDVDHEDARRLLGLND